MTSDARPAAGARPAAARDSGARRPCWHSSPGVGRASTISAPRAHPLVVLHGHVEPTTLVRSHPGAALIGALVWAEVASVDPVCLEFDDARIEPACPDPYGVFNGAVEASRRWTPPAASTSAQPSADGERVRGRRRTRIAYGSLMAVEDVDGNGQPGLLALPRRRRMFEAPTPQPSKVPDTIVAATFHSLRADQTRVVFREGGFDAVSYFYPLPGCAPPPSGFSILSAPPYATRRRPAGGCVDTTTETWSR